MVRAYETVSVNMPPFALDRARSVVEATGHRADAAGRLGAKVGGVEVVGAAA